MKTLIKYSILSCIGLMASGFFNLKAQEFYKLEDFEIPGNPAESWSNDQLAVKVAVEGFLAAAGNYDSETIAKMTTANANMGITRLEDGKWITETILVSEFQETFKDKHKIPYLEPVTEYNIQVSDNNLAIVKTDAMLYRFGIPISYERDNFTLLKEDGFWKFVNISFSATPVPNHKQQFDLLAFAKGYNQVWCSGKPEFVAQFFAENGSLKVNDGDPAVGRRAVAEIVQNFMTAFPDMVLTCDSVNVTNKGTEFHWTLTGTNTGPNGKGKKVQFSGMELWQLTDNGRIKTSDGRFDTLEYNDQVEHGITE